MNEQYTTSYTQEQRKQIIIEAYKRGFNTGYWLAIMLSMVAMAGGLGLYILIK